MIKDKLLAQRKVQSIKAYHEMKAEEVKKLILKAVGVTHYTVPHCDGVSKFLTKSSDQNVDGNDMADQRGGLHICENMQVIILVYIYNDDP